MEAQPAKFLTAKDVARELKISRSAAYSLMHEIGAVFVGRGSLRRGAQPLAEVPAGAAECGPEKHAVSGPHPRAQRAL